MMVTFYALFNDIEYLAMSESRLSIEKPMD